MAEGTQVGALYYDLTIDDKNLKGQLDDADKNVSGFADKLKGGFVKAAAGFAVVGAGLSVISKQSLDFAVDTVKSSKALATQIGTTTEEASRLVAAFGRMGISAENASQMFGIFSKKIVAATQDSKDQASAAGAAQLAIEKTQRQIAQTTAEIQKNGDKSGDLTFKLKELNQTLADQQAKLSSATNAFQKLGISTVDTSGKQKDFNSILFEVADKFKEMPNGIEKNALALELFGRSGQSMVKVLNLGSEGIKDLEAQADKLGLTLTSQNIAAVNDYIKSQKDLKQSTDALKLAIGTTTAPVLTDFNKALNDVIMSLIGTDGPLKDLTVGFLAFAGPVFGGISALFSFAAAVVQVGEAVGFALLGTIGIVILAIAALGVAIYFMIQNSEALGTAFVIVTDRIGMAAKAVWQWIVDNWPYLLGALFGPFGLAVAYISQHLEEIKNAVKNAASDAWHWLYNAGRDIIGGLVQGIKDKVGDAINAVKGVGKSIVNAARSALDWHSPSKIFIEAGKSISEGMAIGIRRSASQAVGAMSALSNSVVAPNVGFGGASPAGAGAGGNTTNFGDTVVNIGQINNAQDESYVLRRLDRNQDLDSKGLSPQ